MDESRRAMCTNTKIKSRHVSTRKMKRALFFAARNIYRSKTVDDISISDINIVINSIGGIKARKIK